MKRASVLVALAIVLAGGAGLMTAQNRPAAGRMAAFIPRTIGPWLSEADHVYDAETIFQYIDGAGEVYRSYNMKVLVSRRFHKDGRPDIVVDLFDMGSSLDAFGVFTHDLDGEDADVGQGSNYKAGQLSFWKDRYFGSLSTEEENKDTKAAVFELGRLIAAAIPKEGPKPKLLSYLPAEGLDAGHVCYFHNHSILNYHFFVAEGDILLLEQTASAVLAPYKSARGKSFLLVVVYPDEAKAARAYDSFAKSYMPDAQKTGIVRTEDKKWTASARSGDILIVVFNADSDEFAMNQLALVQELIEAANKK
ncbi:MAG: DUF6599 family protein [Candidatus Aminicenantales bacterium]|jgi:hypothetical protein